jgi:hypothetical protein
MAALWADGGAAAALDASAPMMLFGLPILAIEQPRLGIERLAQT